MFLWQGRLRSYFGNYHPCTVAKIEMERYILQFPSFEKHLVILSFSKYNSLLRFPCLKFVLLMQRLNFTQSSSGFLQMFKTREIQIFWELWLYKVAANEIALHFLLSKFSSLEQHLISELWFLLWLSTFPQHGYPPSNMAICPRDF